MAGPGAASRRLPAADIVPKASCYPRPMTGDPPDKLPADLAVAIVIYRSDAHWLERTLASLRLALISAHDDGAIRAARVYLVDNGAANRASDFQPLLERIFAAPPPWQSVQVIAGQGNIGYGAGNNLAFRRDADAGLLLVLNPDVELDPAAIANGVRHLDTHADCAMVTPVATDAAGGPLYLAKTAPRVSTLALRGFAPAWVRSRFAARLARYERRETGWDAALDDVEFASGCFMLMRRDAFDRVGGFDQSFFLYFEDFDLSARISRQSRIARVAGCRIVHGGGGAGSKGLGHTRMFMASAVRFFAKHGWRW